MYVQLHAIHCTAHSRTSNIIHRGALFECLFSGHACYRVILVSTLAGMLGASIEYSWNSMPQMNNFNRFPNLVSTMNVKKYTVQKVVRKIPLQCGRSVFSVPEYLEKKKN